MLTFSIEAAWDRVKNEDHVVGSEGENEAIDLFFTTIYTKLPQLNEICKMKNELTKDCAQLLRTILSDKPEMHEYILAVVAKADKIGKLTATPPFPNFYGYLIDGTKNHLMLRLKITQNVPKGSIKIMKSRTLVHHEELLNLKSNFETFEDKLGKVTFAEKTWAINTTKYKDAELILVFRSKAEEWLRSQPLERSTPLPDEYFYTYQNHVLNIKLQDGSACLLDLSNAPILRPIFESFYYLFIENERKLFTKEQLLRKYKEITGQPIDWSLFIKRKSSISGKMIKGKSCLENRIIWKYDKIYKAHKFEITL